MSESNTGLTVQQLSVYPITPEEVSVLVSKYADLKVDGVNDKYGLAQVTKGRKAMKAARVDIDRARKESNEEAQASIKRMNAYARELTGPVAGAETMLKEEEARIDALVLEVQTAALAGRQEKLLAVEARYPDSIIMKMKDGEFADLLFVSTETFNEAQELKKREAEAEAAERVEQKAREAAERVEQKARDDAEAAERKAKQDAERAEQKAKEDAEAAERKAKQDAEDAERAEQKAKEDAEAAERKAKQDAEDAERAEQKAKEDAEARRVELLPAVDAVKEYLRAVSALLIPETPWKGKITGLVYAFRADVTELIK